MTDDFIMYGIVVGGRDAADPTQIAAIFIAYYMGQGSIKPIIRLNSLTNRKEQQEGALEFITQYIDFFRQWASRRADGDKKLLQEIENYIMGLWKWLKQDTEKEQLDDIEHQRLRAQKKSLTEKLYDHIPERLISGGQTSIERLLDDIQNYEYVIDCPLIPSFKWQNEEIERVGVIYERIELLMRLINKLYSECATKYHYLHYLRKMESDISSYTGDLEISRDKYDGNIVDNNIEEYWKIFKNNIEEYKRRFYRQHLPRLKEFRREVLQDKKTDQERLQEIINALKRHKESGDISTRNDSGYYSDDELWEDLQKVKARFPPIRSLSDLLYKYKDQCTEKTVDVIIQLGRAVRHGVGYDSELLDNLSRDEVLEDIESCNIRDNHQQSEAETKQNIGQQEKDKQSKEQPKKITKLTDFINNNCEDTESIQSKANRIHELVKKDKINFMPKPVNEPKNNETKLYDEEELRQVWSKLKEKVISLPNLKD